MSRHQELIAKHGTLQEFTAAVKRAIGEISVAEADQAIEKYQKDLLIAQAADELFQWLPMKTAPRDGTEVLLVVERRAGIPYCKLVGHWMPGGHCIEDHPPIAEGWYFWNGSMFDKASKPLVWMPLPSHP